MTRFAAILLLCALPLFCQSNSGELRLKVTDPAGLAVKTTVQIASKANGYRNNLATTDEGRLDVQRLPYGIYQNSSFSPGCKMRRVPASRSAFRPSALQFAGSSPSTKGPEPVIFHSMNCGRV